MGNVTRAKALGRTGFASSLGGYDVHLEEPTSDLYSDRLYNDPSVSVNNASKADIQV